MSEATQPVEPVTDAELVARWREGDERAAAALVERHAGSVARFVVSLGEPSDVEEVVQDTFVRAFGSLESFRADSSLRTWLFTIARNLVRDRVRGVRRRPRMVPVEDEHAVSDYDALDRVVARESAARLLHAVTRLSPTQREVFTLRVTEGLSYREIAEVVGTTEGAARVHYHSATRVLKELLDD